MLLVLTNSGDATADYLVSKLEQRCIAHVRLDTDSLLDRVRVGYAPGEPRIAIDGVWYKPEDFSTVWYRRPERLRSGGVPDSPEGKCVLDEWTEALEGFFAHIPESRWMNHPVANASASRKLEQLTTARALGFQIPDTLVTQDESALRQFFRKHGGEVIVKPMGRAYIERPDSDCDSLIFTNRVSENDMQSLDDLPRCPTLFQQAVPKRSDIRITVVGACVHAVELLASDENGRQRCDIRRNNMADVIYRPVALPDHVSSGVRSLLKHYGLRFAAIDMAISDNGEWFFFEINPNGQWAWLDICGGTRIFEDFVGAFAAACAGSGKGG